MNFNLYFKLVSSIYGMIWTNVIISFWQLLLAGAPYDTLEEVIGKRDSHGLGFLKDFGVNC